jgi:CRISPR-associated protein Cas1
MASGRNRNATHPVNAMLNYAYAVLESQVRIATVSQGLDPHVGYLHACRPGRVALVYDLMEPLRPQIDHLILDFLRSHTLSPSDFLLGTDGVCRLHTQLAKHLTKTIMIDNLVQQSVLGLVTVLKDSSESQKDIFVT